MKKSQNKLLNIAKTLFPGRKEAFDKYLELKRLLEAMSSEELDFEYGKTVAAYENKKGAWGLLWGTAVVSILVGLWSAFFKAVQAFLMYAQTDSSIDPIEAATIGIAVVAPVVVSITVFVLILFRNSMKESKKLKEKILLIETIKKKRA